MKHSIQSPQKKRLGFRLLLALLTLALLSGSLFAQAISFAEEAAPLRPQDFDLSGVQEVAGRLIGEIPDPKGQGAPLRVDCPIPMAFAPEQQQRLTVEYRKITKKELTKAIEAIGQSTKVGSLYQYIGTPERLVQYERETGLDWMDSLMSGQVMEAPDLQGHPYEDKLLAAKELTKDLMAQLGASPYEGTLHARRFDEDSVWRYSTTATSSEAKLRDLAADAFAKNEAKHGRTERNITMVSALYELNDLPVMPQFSYSLGGKGRAQAGSSFLYALRDDGVLMLAQAECLPLVKNAEPIQLPQRSWEDLLRAWMVNHYHFEGRRSDFTYEGELFGETTVYASYQILTEFKPCYVGLSKTTLEPGYCTVVETRVQKDDSLVYELYTAMDALELKDILWG